jgi:hypothetical protein
MYTASINADVDAEYTVITPAVLIRALARVLMLEPFPVATVKTFGRNPFGNVPIVVDVFAVSPLMPICT